MSFLGFLIGEDLAAEQKRSDDLDRQLAEYEREYQKRHAQDMTAAELEKRQAIFEKHQADGKVENVEAEVNEAFYEGLDEGATNIRNFIGGAIDTAGRSIFGIIPWQVWIAALVFAFIYFDGMRLFRQRAA